MSWSWSWSWSWRQIGLAGSIALGSSVAGATSTESPAQSKADVIGQATENQMTLKIIPPSGAILNLLGPWKLALKGDQKFFSGQSDASADLTKFDKVSGQFAIPLDTTKSSTGTISYNLTYFLCSSDKSWCKRDTASGQIKVTGATKAL